MRLMVGGLVWVGLEVGVEQKKVLARAEALR